MNAFDAFAYIFFYFECSWIEERFYTKSKTSEIFKNLYAVFVIFVVFYVDFYTLDMHYRVKSFQFINIYYLQNILKWLIFTVIILDFTETILIKIKKESELVHPEEKFSTLAIL